MRIFFPILLQLGICDDCQQLVGETPNFSPIRIHVEYVEAMNSQILRDRVIPAVVAFFEKAVTVRRRTRKIFIPRWDNQPSRRCGRVTVPARMMEGSAGVDADLAVFVTTSNDQDSDTEASACACFRDTCGRPIAGMIEISESFLASVSSPMQINYAIETLIHEFVHILVFSKASFVEFRNPVSMQKLVPTLRTVRYQCTPILDETNKFQIEWDVDPMSGNSGDLHVFHFMPQIVSQIQVRGVTKEKCRCPSDPSVQYTNADIEACLHHVNNCAFAITTPRVAAATKEYFNCPSAVGMEIENAFDSFCGKIGTAHWKSRLLNHELMAPASAWGDTQFISPITFALFEDSGWYRMNYAMATPMPIPHVFWGHLAGCPFLHDKCVDSAGNALATGSKTFCVPGGNPFSCSPDHLRVVACSYTGGPEEEPADLTQLTQYKYPRTPYRHRLQRFDHCPIFENTYGGNCVDSNLLSLAQYFNPDARCHEVVRFANLQGFSSRASPECVRSACAADRSRYRVILDGISANADCTEKNQLVYVIRNRQKSEVRCGDPKLVCAQWVYPHLPGMLAVPSGGSLSGVPPTVKDSPDNVDYLKKSASGLDSFALLIGIIGLIHLI